jgi:putative membrane-bound dehydrogenase-like protein
MKALLRHTLVVLSFTTFSASLPVARAADSFDPGVKDFVQQFKGKGALEDGSKPLSPEETLKHFIVAKDMEVQVVGAEPLIRQPLNLHFDERGRLWVVEYLQYPFPAGLKVVKYDQYLRAVFDKVPAAPPNHVKGADKIIIMEDTDGDGVFEKSKTFVEGLNIATSVAVGRGGVWVLNPPYLLFYPDKNRDDIPDGPPEVKLSGFGLEDTHAVATSLHWGPDGWLYGANGSTTTGTVKGVHWLGQAIWRYHPERDVFEIFAEGGGNTMSVEFDKKGRTFSGTNYGDTRGMHYEQGSRGVKNWGKHGPLMNPYSFGWFEHMAHDGFKPRFAQSMVIYEGGAIPELEGKVVASMSLMNRVVASELLPDTSTYRTRDLDPLILTDDRWFRIVDTRTGPDGAIYLADWYDSRLTHVDPRDTWDRDHGRIYRLQAKGAKPIAPFDLGKLSSKELLPYLSHPNKWFRQTAVRLLYDRKDKSLIPTLRELVTKNSGQLALDAFWALNASGGFDATFALQTINHANADVRAWTARLLGDDDKVTPAMREKLIALARTEADVHARVQLAASCRRLPAADAIPVLRELMLRTEDVADKHTPLMLWWALEDKAITDRAQILELLKETPLWHTPIVSQHIIARLGQRYTAERTEENLNTAAQLLAMAPTPEDVDKLVKGMEQGLEGDVVKSVPPALSKQVAEVWKTRPASGTLISFATRLGYEQAAQAALEKVADAKTPSADRRKYLELLSERRVAAAVPVFLNLLRAEKVENFRLDILNALQRFSDAGIGQAVLELYPSLSNRVRASAQTILTSRKDWSAQLLAAVDKGVIKPSQISPINLAAIQNHKDAELDKLIQKHWGRLRQSPKEIEGKIASVRALLAKGKGDAKAGKELFTVVCATCHTLFGEGAKIGPELTGYERDNMDFMLPAIIDPSLGIREEYTVFNVNTKDGQTITGFLEENTPQSITVKDPTGNKIKLALEQVKSLEASHTSLMPEGLIDALNEEQIRDLFAYLTKK